MTAVLEEFRPVTAAFVIGAQRTADAVLAPLPEESYGEPSACCWGLTDTASYRHPNSGVDAEFYDAYGRSGGEPERCR
jgi:hypothetical protein